jgi:quercetin 2,3-dioxygenase
MPTVFFPAGKRGHVQTDWLDTWHSFSFGEFYDPGLMGFGALRVVNDDTIAPGTGFDFHPHQDMEIITLPFSGALAHADTIGGKGVVRAGDVQVMSAGTGVLHSERNASPDEPVSLFQIWIMTDRRGHAPRYDQRTFSIREREGKFQLVVSPDGRAGSLSIHQNAFVSLATFQEKTPFSYQLNDPHNGLFLMSVEGTVTLDGAVLGRRDAVGVTGTKTVVFDSEPGTSILALEIPIE